MAISRSASWAAMKIHLFLLAYLITPLELLLFLYTHLSMPTDYLHQITHCPGDSDACSKLLETVSLNENMDCIGLVIDKGYFLILELSSLKHHVE